MYFEVKKPLGKCAPNFFPSYNFFVELTLNNCNKDSGFALVGRKGPGGRKGGILWREDCIKGTGVWIEYTGSFLF